MFKLFILYSHLLATCTALGVIIAADLQLLNRLSRPRLRLEPPGRFVKPLITVSLAALYVTGGLLIWLGLQERPDDLLNTQLVGKLVLAGVLTANAVLLHHIVFPRLPNMKAVAAWSASDRLRVAVPVALSNSLWMVCAFLGIAQPWRYSMPLFNVLGISALVFAVVLAGVVWTLKVAAIPRMAPPPREYDGHEFLAT